MRVFEDIPKNRLPVLEIDNIINFLLCQFNIDGIFKKKNFTNIEQINYPHRTISLGR